MRSHYLWVRVRLGSGDNAGHEKDPFVGSNRVSAFIESRDGEGEEMDPGPVVGLKRGNASGSLWNVYEDSDFMRVRSPLV